MRSLTVAWSIGRLLTAVLVLAAVFAQFAETLGNATARGQDLPTVIANFFSYFTILSNLLAATALIVAAIGALRGIRESAAVGVLLASATTFLFITFAVYNALLRNLPPAPGAAETVPWSNEVVHVVAPLLLVVDLLCSPGRRRLSWNALIAVIGLPLVWVAYTLVRANLVADPVTGTPSWYPYPFLNPNGPDGWGGVWISVGLIAVAFVGVGSLVILVTRLRARHGAQAHAH